MGCYRLLRRLLRERLKELDMPKQTQRYAFAALLCTCLFVCGPIGHAQEQGRPDAEQQAEL